MLSDITFLLLAIFSSSCLQITLRLSQSKGKNIMAAIATNYLVAAVICLVTLVFNGSMKISTFALYFGAFMGLIFLFGLVVMTVAFNQKGVALTSSIVQLSILIPIVLSITLWMESTTLTQIAGILLALASLPLLSVKETGFSSINRKVIFTTVILFFVNGFAMSSGKILLETGYASEQIIFYFILFTTAFIVSIPLVIRTAIRPTRADFGYGSIIGFFNALSNIGLVIALGTIPASIAFPLLSSVGLLITVVLSVVLLHERINKINAFGIVLCLIAVILINL